MSETTELIGAIGGALGGISAIVGYFVAGKAEAAKAEAKKATAKAVEAISKAEDAQTKAQVGWLELQLRVFISSRRDRIHDITRDLESIRAGIPPQELSETAKVQLAGMKLLFISAHEDFLGALEQACRHYRDSKVDQESFRRMYDNEVRKIVETKGEHPFNALINPEGSSKFRAIWAVYREWFDLENKK